MKYLFSADYWKAKIYIYIGKEIKPLTNIVINNNKRYCQYIRISPSTMISCEPETSLDKQRIKSL